ncbi:hypothetical protein Ahy_A04g018158 [Arachis hypogaea]|uniref:Uncharacterized protein n=1 Tax=Arachis hypogaea TaxID=3818 RepID=A0A445DCZ3_ARAHY|nr:hypothetical protein Ahy_A04g018158 [Arachis hypogaea]
MTYRSHAPKRHRFTTFPNLSNSRALILRLHRNGEWVERKKERLRAIASNGVSSNSRRSGGGGREDQFAASSIPNGKDSKDGISPKCFCRENTIMFLLKTRNNPNRLFMGCPFYKVFLWLDEHIARIGMTETRYLGKKKIGDVEEHYGKQDMKIRITYLEKRIIVLEMKKNSIEWCIRVIFIVSVVVLSCKN